MGQVKPHFRKGRRRPWEARWYVDRKPYSKFFESEKDRDAWMKKQQAAIDKHGSKSIAASPRALERLARAQAMVGEHVDFVEVAKFWIAHHSQRKAIRFNDAAQAFVDFEDRKDPDADRIKIYRKHLERFAVVARNRPINEITKQEIHKWAYGLPYAPQTIRHHLKNLSAMFAHFVRQDVIARNPCSGIERPESADVEPETIHPSVLREILAANLQYPDVCALLALNCFGLFRASAVSRIEYEDIDFGAKGIRTPAIKTKKERRRFLQGHPDVLWDWLALASKDAFAKTIPEVDLNTRMGKKDLAQWKRQCKRRFEHLRTEALKRSGHLLEIGDIRKENEERLAKGLPPTKKKPHALPHNWARHSCLTYHVQHFKDAGRTAYLASHTGNAQQLYESYIGERSDAEAALWWSLTPDVVRAWASKHWPAGKTANNGAS